MEKRTHIWHEEPERHDGRIIVSAVLEVPGSDRKKLWYSMPIEYETFLSKNADPFVIGTIYMIMQSGYDTQVHGEVSPSLLCNLEEFQSIWVSWMPDLKKSIIQANQEIEPVYSHQRNESVVAFSGGVDSCFTVFSQNHGPVRPNPSRLTAGVMVHGFDIPLDQIDAFESALEQSRTLLTSMGLDLIPIQTNYQALGMDWSHSFGAGAASCLALFSGRFKVGFISQGLTYGEFGLLHEGSNPLTDPLLSSDTFRIIPAGTNFDRASKIYSMRNWEEFLRYLRVCWQGPQKDQNCCECEKCMRNILTFRALGLGLPPCFKKDISTVTIKSLGLGTGFLPEIRYGGLAQLAAAHNTEGEWITILEKRLEAIRHLRRTQHSKFWQLYRKSRRRIGKMRASFRQKRQ